jgi:outer membrane protein assembly factor BamB
MRLLTLTLGLVVATATAAPAHAATSPAWDHPGYDAEDSYYNPGESTINASTIGVLTRRWSVPLRARDGACTGPSAPVVAGGRLFATDDLGISAYQAAGGAPIWRFGWDDPDDSSTPRLAVAGSRLIAANGDCHSNSDPDGTITALDAATGQVRWHVRTDIPIVTVAVDKDVVVVSGESPSDEQATIAFRTTDGRRLWSKTDYSSSGVSANGTLLLTHSSTTVAVAITTGAVQWTKPQIWYAQCATPASDRFIVNAGTGLASIDASTGALLWTAPGEAGELIATDGRRVYRASDQAVEALDARSGRRSWSRQLPAEAQQPVRAGGLLYTGGPVLNAATGTVASPGTAFTGQQIVTGGRLYAVTGRTLSSFTP